ncbi:MAG: hypothetical protein A3I77_02345 [Gammaproteobacteria bacterium RIFCSPLOWO2_02_FULL_42_14]|nr:MAG: hypothetical protein A3B71_02185 [Gammaproteobacteria bacterium RIFCSPHIGHO2_02_FULL_42_43]OGT28999.1 MAG: hypothetical protein A2624_00135 [Gammaproteobacteria bacterium RIFCSPHIGHO2_01_FULL_42_8]OGT53495.1 MAG: hypothetical protein A3E54_02210 [Gammaproteobacteria bacterium RIFCSPHIGHO2_12_FULL_41_25]OGT61441.1 MAG: hypothetical protein A3I77_02345 [Gammaproteobacteria bacterium RIFCSPLOWO2_02_FULL_42_14]OGT86495.1 MAG: hypothetical protein A3G86_02570 [Gammaproteobacteria bacterium R
MTNNIADISRSFLGKPYVAGAQGEGERGEFDRAPLFRFDAFDCVTYVNNVLALSLSHSPAEFEKKLLQINYYDADPKFEKRFHFMSADWNLQNQKNKIIRDVTNEIFDEKKNCVAIVAEGEIDKSSWFLKKSENECGTRADFLKRVSEKFKMEWVRLPYLPLTQLFDTKKNPNEFIFSQIPHESIIEIVRPNWDLRDKIGTRLHVSHVGFGIREKNKLLFRHASSEAGCVGEIALVDYLKKYLDSPTVRGINVQVITEIPGEQKIFILGRS